MQSETDTEKNFRLGSPVDNPGSASFGVFSGSQHFTVAGGTFTNITKNYHTPTELSDFRRIPLGDVDLQREIRMGSDSGVVSVRRLHSAKIDRGETSVAVAMYQGKSAEEEWRRDIAKYMAVRHPNIVQLCGVTTEEKIHAAIFYDELIPLQIFLDLHCDSRFSTTYIRIYCQSEFKAATSYFYSMFQHTLWDTQCTFFIRCSSGRFCVDLAPGTIWLKQYALGGQSYEQGLKPLVTLKMEATSVINSLTLDLYHEICYRILAKLHSIPTCPSVTVNLGAVIYSSFGKKSKDFVEIASLQTAVLNLDELFWHVVESKVVGEVIENGWTRFTCNEALGTMIWLQVYARNAMSWLSQANHLFNSLGISSNLDHYVLVDDVSFWLSISPTKTDPPKGFLFLCPPKHFQTGQSLLKCPDCPAYWSLDHTGTEQLSMEDAATLGFPILKLSPIIQGMIWNTDVYTELGRFHQAKGFDADSQGIAQHLGYPLYEVSRKTHLSCGYDEPESQHILPSVDSGDVNLVTTSTIKDLFLADELPVPGTFKFVINVQLLLILLSVLSGIYDQL